MSGQLQILCVDDNMYLSLLQPGRYWGPRKWILANVSVEIRICMNLIKFNAEIKEEKMEKVLNK